MSLPTKRPGKLRSRAWANCLEIYVERIRREYKVDVEVVLPR